MSDCNAQYFGNIRKEERHACNRILKNLIIKLSFMLLIKTVTFIIRHRFPGHGEIARWNIIFLEIRQCSLKYLLFSRCKLNLPYNLSFYRLKMKSDIWREFLSCFKCVMKTTDCNRNKLHPLPSKQLYKNKNNRRC